LTEKLLRAGKQRIKALELVPFSDGRFEIFKNGKMVYSKLQQGSFPDEGEITDQLFQALR
jgi:selT/selW/selH-like putative selenoprotein